MSAPDLERIRKIAELAKRGVGGEASNAQAILDRLLREHGLTLESLDGERKSVRTFKYDGALERMLLMQIASNVINTMNIPTYRFTNGGKTVKETVGIELTDSEYIELEMRFELYRAALKRHMDIAYHAFIQTNKIFCDESKVRRKLTDEERKKARDILRMSEAIDAVKIHKQLEARP